jgi:hypothetical protein
LFSKIVFAFQVFCASQAEAEDAPADTAGFISICATNFDVCRSKVLEINNYQTMIRMGMIKGDRGCTYPSTATKDGDSIRATVRADSTAAANAILIWMKDHRASLAPKTTDAITQAERALWPSGCR